MASFRAALRAFLRTSEQIAQANGLTPRRHLLLLMIKGAPDRSESATITELAERLQLAQSTVTELVKRAVEVGHCCSGTLLRRCAHRPLATERRRRTPPRARLHEPHSRTREAVGHASRPRDAVERAKRRAMSTALATAGWTQAARQTIRVGRNEALARRSSDDRETQHSSERLSICCESEGERSRGTLTLVRSDYAHIGAPSSCRGARLARWFALFAVMRFPRAGVWR